MITTKHLTESLERNYLSEGVNDEVNKVIRRNRKKSIKSISDEDKEFLKQNGVIIQGRENERPYFQGKGRVFQASNGKENSSYGRSNNYKEYGIDFVPDFSNKQFDIKGWLDKEKSIQASQKEIDRTLRPYSDEAKRSLERIHQHEINGRKARLENEAELANRLEDEDVYDNRFNRQFYGSNREYADYGRGGDFDYKYARDERERLANEIKKKKEEHGIYEDLNESMDGPGTNLMYGLVDLLGDEQVLDAIIRYLPDGELQTLCDYLMTDFDIDSEML